MLRRAVVAVVAAAALAPAASADTGVDVSVNGRATVFLSRGDLGNDVDVPYGTKVTVRDSDGTRTATEGGTSIAEIARLAHITPEHVRRVEATDPNAGRTITLSAAEVKDGFSGDPLGTRKATVDARYGPVHFFRPLRDGDDHTDSIDTPGGVDLAVAITTDNTALREVEASADDTTLDPGESDGFSARLEDPPGGVSFTYDWDFADGTHAQGLAPAHAFPAGHYQVRVSAVGSDGSSGVSDPIEIQVGSPDAATPGPTPSPAPASDGPAGTGGGHPSPGADSTGSTGGGDDSPQQGTSGTKRPRPHRDRPAARATSTPTAAPFTSPSPAPTASAAPSTTATPSPSATITAAPSHRRRERPPTPAPDTPSGSVHGILLAGTGDPAQIDDLIRQAAAQPAPDVPAARRGGGGGSILGWAGGGVLLVLLLAGGAAAEVRGLR